MDIPTPKTDAEAMRRSKTGKRMSPNIKADFARELEREIAGLHDRLSQLKKLSQPVTGEPNDIE
jgi:hypothetical protein